MRVLYLHAGKVVVLPALALHEDAQPRLLGARLDHLQHLLVAVDTAVGLSWGREGREGREIGRAHV